MGVFFRGLKNSPEICGVVHIDLTDTTVGISGLEPLLRRPPTGAGMHHRLLGRMVAACRVLLTAAPGAERATDWGVRLPWRGHLAHCLRACLSSIWRTDDDM